MDKIRMVHRDSLSCEAIVRRLQGGDLLLVCQCGGKGEPAPENRVLVFHSDDNGESWSSPELIRQDDGRAVYATDIDVRGGEISVYITEHNGGYLDDVCYTLFSTDGGKSWQKRELPYFKDEFVFLRGAISARDGRRIIAYQRMSISEEENNALKAAGKTILDSGLPAIECGTLATDDGVNYRKSNGILIPNTFGGKRIWQWPEPTVTELSSGFAMLLRVNGSGILYRSDSKDGEHWSEPYPTDIPNPGNKPKLIGLEGGGVALVHTPNGTPGMKNRNPLEIWISDDDMKTWRYKKRVLDFPGWLSYPDGFAEGERIVFSFEVNRHDIYLADCDISDYYRK